MRTYNSMRWLVVVAGAVMLLAVVAACAGETVEVPGETVVVEKVVTETVEVPGETVVVEKEVIKTVEVPGETVTKEVVKEVMVPGETVVVKEEVVKTVEVPGQTVVKEVVKTVEVPGQTVVVEKEVVKTVEVPGETVVVEKEVVKTVEVPGQTVVVEKVVVQEVPGKKYATDPTTGKAVSAPQYGGTLTVARKNTPPEVDGYFGHPSQMAYTGDVERLGIVNWAIDRDVFNFGNAYIPPEVLVGSLAESWETPDPVTIIINVRKGVRWHDEEPVNGRELTAQDVEYNYHRYLGLGSGFTQGSPFIAQWEALDDIGIESITATDKYTVVFKLAGPSLDALKVIVITNPAVINAPEVIKAYITTEEPDGHIPDYRALVGTGPFMLVESIEATSMTWTKNPNYWGYDEKYPENRLPYIDELRALVIPEETTRLAAMRSAKIDHMGISTGGNISIEVADGVKRTNPELLLHGSSGGSLSAAFFNTRISPTNDIMVRHAMQMALDLETINNTYYKGFADATPQEYLGPGLLGYSNPFETWPAEVKKYYIYDPEGAEKLLDEAGYPRGADGIRFRTDLEVRCCAGFSHDLGFHQIAATYWKEIGIDVEVKPLETAVWAAHIREATYEGLTSWGNMDWSPIGQLSHNLSTSAWNGPLTQDLVYDAMVQAVVDATTIEEQQRLSREASMYITSNHWMLWGPRESTFSVTQPWVTGYNGEGPFNGLNIFARLWIDSELKEAMGH